MGDPVVGIHSLDRLYTLYRDDLLIAPFMGLLTYPLQIRYLDSPFLERLYWEPLFEDVLLTAPLWWPYFRFYENALNSGINILQVCADRWSRKIFNLFKKLGRYHYLSTAIEQKLQPYVHTFIYSFFGILCNTIVLHVMQNKRLR